MTCDRSRAYGRVMHTLGELGPSKLTPAEQTRIRDAADALLFSEDLAVDAGARAALEDVRALMADLVHADRWLEERATRLLADVEGCGPALVAA